MIKHSSKVKVDDLQGLILVTSVVASATDKSEELSEESQVGKLTRCCKVNCARHGGLMISAMDTGSVGPDSCPARGSKLCS